MSRRMKSNLAWNLMISFLFIGFATAAAAQILVGENFPITTAPDFQSGPAIAANSINGDFLVVWHDLRPFGGSGFDIFGQQVASDGALIGTAFPVTAAGGSRPALVFNPTMNEFFVVYDRVFGGILGQRVAADGSLIGGEIPIFAGVSQANAVVAYNSVSNNEYLVVWGQSAGGVRGRIINAEGVPVTAAFDLSTGLIGAGNPSVVFNAATNQFFVVWDAFASPFFPGITEIFGRLVNADGTLAGPFFAITTANEIQAFPSVTLNSVADQFLVVWSDNRNIGVTSGDIFGQLVNDNGSLAGGNVPISTFPFNGGVPSVAYSPATNQYLAVWVGQPSGGPPISDVFGRLLAADGSSLGDAFQVSTAGKAQFFTDLTVNPVTNSFLSVWPDDRNAALSSTDIFGQIITLVIQVGIDIKPGSDENNINPRSRGKIPVAILSSDEFDATSHVDQGTLTFGRTGDEPSLAFCNSNGEDVNGDTLLDLVCHFHTQASAFQPGDTQGILRGNTSDGVSIIGTDSVRIVPPQ